MLGPKEGTLDSIARDTQISQGGSGGAPSHSSIPRITRYGQRRYEEWLIFSCRLLLVVVEIVKDSSRKKEGIDKGRFIFFV